MAVVLVGELINGSGSDCGFFYPRSSPALFRDITVSKSIQEVFLELEWNDEAEARQARDQRAAELQQQGYLCVYENLFTVYGHRVFLLKASLPEPVEAAATSPKRSLVPRLKRANVQSFEQR
jgi:hypothetical protein